MLSAARLVMKGMNTARLNFREGSTNQLPHYSSRTLLPMKGLPLIFSALAGILIGVFLCGGSSASAATPIININPSTDVPTPYWGFDEGHGNGMVGWSFQTLEPFIITQVGWYDETGDGLSRPFQVG